MEKVKYLFKILFFISSIMSVLVTSCYANPMKIIQQNTLELKNINDLLAKSNNTQAINLEHIKDIAKQRQAAIIKQLHLDTKFVLKYLLSKPNTNRLPAALQFYIEREVANVDGVVEVRTAVIQSKKSKEKLTMPSQHEFKQYLIKTKNQHVYILNFTNTKIPPIKTGDYVRLTHALEIAQHDNVHVIVITNDNSLLVLKKATINVKPEAFGPQKTLVFLVNFQNQPNNKPWTLTQVNDVVFNQTNNIYLQHSYGQTTIVGDVVGWYTIALNSNFDCWNNIDTLANLAINAATQAGVNVAAYKRRVFMFPNTNACSWAGLGTIGGNPSSSWINGYNYAYIIGHELGHNVGVDHARMLQCAGSSNQGNCSVLEYGDQADIMGGGGPAHMNAYLKDYLGWLNYQQSPPITTVTTSGTYKIYPYETQDRNAKALKILRRVVNGRPEYYYLEYRQAIGVDSHLGTCNDCDFTKGVLVHQSNSNAFEGSELLDMSPSDNNRRLVTLLPGRSFSDLNAANGGVTFTVNSVAADGANVNVTFGQTPPPTCERAVPSMWISPSTTQWVQPGGNANYMITIKNNDSTGCGNSTFALDANVGQVCMRATLNANTITLAPGAGGVVRLNLLSSNIANPGVYTATVRAKNNAASDKTNVVRAYLGING